MTSKIRVLHAPTDVGGNAWYLSRAERALGIQSDVVYFDSAYFGFASDRNLRFNDRSYLNREITRFRFILSAIKHYDIFHFNFGRSLLSYPRFGVQHLDLPLLKRLGKKIVVTYQGCDVRRYDFAVDHFPISACIDCRKCIGLIDVRKRSAVEKVEKYADHIYYLNPDHAYLLPARAEYRPYTKLMPSEWPEVGVDIDAKILRIVHAPTNRIKKGTQYIQSAVDVLQKEGLSIELILVEGVTREEALAYFRQADIVVDQILIGWYGGVAVEAMALGKPVVCYLRRSDFTVIPDDMATEIPIVSSTPETILQVLRELAKNPSRRVDLGRRGRMFIEKWHDPIVIAEQTKALYHRLSRM